MLYRFTSRSVADLIMLPAHGEHMLKIMGKEPTPQGIIVALEIPVAVAALQAAVQTDAETPAAQKAQDLPTDNTSKPDSSIDMENEQEPISLKRRAAPLIDMLTRSAKNNHDVMWST